MKKWMSLMIVAVMALVCLTACGKSLEVNESTVYVQKNGKIVEATVESLDKEYYDEEELENYINEQVDEFVEENGSKSMVVEEFKVEEGVAKLNVKYAGYGDYSLFHGTEMFVGTIKQAQEAGYKFEGQFVQVTGGNAGGSVAAEQVTANTGYYVVILDECVNVKVEGDVLYYTEGNGTLVSDDTVAIGIGEENVKESNGQTYIIYK